jgi:uncharacterized protein involved in exopolysaccharide biosynthesis
MPDPFAGHLYLDHLRRRWRFPLVAAAVALTAALVFTFAQTPKYTAQVDLIIEPPAANDPRAAMAVSPIYLESLKTYEHLASSNHIFAEAAVKFGLRMRDPERRIEDLKRSVLRVTIPRNTKVLEIAVTLADARKAHELALYLAEQTIKLNRNTGREGDRDLTEAATSAATSAEARFKEAERALRAAMEQSPATASIEADLTGLAARRAELERMSLSASLSLADQEVRAKSLAAGDDTGQDLRILNARIQSTRTHAERLRLEQGTVTAEIASKQKLLAARAAGLEMLTAAYKSAKDARDDTDKRLRELQATTGYRTERLTIVDPGFVPEKPSSPNLPLNLFLAASLSLVVSLIWLTVEFGWSALSAGHDRPKISRIAANS